jgi:dihydroorotase
MEERPMIARTLIKNGTIVTFNKTIFNQDLLIENKKIIKIDTNIEDDNCEIIDATGLYILPGLIDMHCQIKDPGYDYKETFYTAGQSALSGGFTTITYNPNTIPCVDNKAIVEYILIKAEKECDVHVAPYGSLTVGCLGEEISEVGEMQLAGIVAISDGDLAIQDTALIKNVFQYCSMFDLPIITHCEDKSISNKNSINDGIAATYLGISGACISSETIHVMRNLLLAEEYDVRLHLTHISTAKSVEIIRMFKKQGLKITCETSPQYFTLNEEATMGYNTFVKVNPPVRTEEDVQAIIKGIKDGVIDVISSDHNPDTIDSKDTEYELASYGLSSFETAFPVSYTFLVETGVLTLEELVNKMSYKPSRILYLNRGTISEGANADLFIFDPGQEFMVEEKKFKSKAKYSPYDGMFLKGRIKYTFVDGKRFVVDEELY